LLRQDLHYFSGKRVLLLQGPVGPFFYRLSKDLRAAGATVFKINFNGGDWLFYPSSAVSFKGSLASWPAWFSEYIKVQAIDTVILFGDCRPLHYCIRDILTELAIALYVFEEGYWRPNHVTFEEIGVNHHSTLSNQADFYANLPQEKVQYEHVGSAFWPMIAYGFLYAFFANVGKPYFKLYQHHRDMSAVQIFYWLRSLVRKFLYAITEKGIVKRILKLQEEPFFLVPLQIEADYQIRVHSDFKSMHDFIQYVVQSFAHHAAANAVLVFKHHTMDRGHANYRAIIQQLIRQYGLNNRVYYIHDGKLPKLLDAARGVVLINSTVGLSALIHHKPVKALGRAIYNFEGLTYQGDLDDFWRMGSSHLPSQTLVAQFLYYVTKKSQMNGSFYKRLKSANNHTGLKW
jgi:capsular polysaccharide export protein